MRKFIVLGLLSFVTSPAGASSTDAWKQLAQQAKLRCIQASHFKGAKASEPVVFSDESGQLAVLVTGTFPQVSLKGAKGTNLCLYDRRSKTAQVEEANDWRAVR